MKQKNKLFFSNVQDKSTVRAVADIAASKSTTAVALVNQAFTSKIDKAGDQDWIKVTLIAGHTYQIELRGYDTQNGTLQDPFIKGLFNSAGQSMGSAYVDDDSGAGRNAYVSFTPTKTGNYFVSAGAYANATGTYSLLISEDLTAPTLTSIQPSNGTSSVSTSANVVLQFSENVLAGTGSIRIAGDDGHQLIIRASDTAQVQISGAQVVVNPTAALHAGVTYSVALDSNSFKDTSGNVYAGLTAGAAVFETAASTPVSGGKADWTVMVYMAADNNLEYFALLDINELESIASLSGLSITALVDRSSSYDSSNGNWSDTRVAAIQSDTSSSVVSFSAADSWGEMDTGNPQTLTDFILWSVQNRPAENYALVVWNHGGGIDGIAWDDNSYGHLTVDELSTAVSNAINSSTDDGLDRFGLIAMDACLMGMVEVAYPLKDSADVLIVSEELVPGEGFAYDNWLDVFVSPNVNLEQLVGSALSSYASEYAWDSDITLSSLYMSELDTLVYALNQFTTAARSATSQDMAAISRLVAGARHYPSDRSHDFADLGHAMDLIANSSTVTNTQLKNLAALVSDAVDAFVGQDVGTVSQASGLSIYLPYGTDVIDSSYNASNYDFLLAVPLWDDFLMRI